MNKMDNIINELIKIGEEVNNLLSRYIEVHDKLNKTSWRNIIPIPFIFKKIGFEELHNQAVAILAELKEIDLKLEEITKEEEKEITEKEGKFYICLCLFNRALIDTVALLKRILDKLNKQSNSSFKYNIKDYKEDLDLYERARSKYITIGSELNPLFKGMATN